ncbi:carbohydrate kinase [Aureisphaera galaxeae]|uniref:carbohydrate kinase family protein n=1 Tax=Aureisphaera galaxeae TaxID=1538023 RepID=UPI00235028FF|nr:carbohydrate kinase [Aureisphaera galaxeae]MDC8002991.1 carbohydrate kinase [Aureisphaera galaxeae]
MKDEQRDIDILSIGETLIDFIGTQVEKPIKETKDYHRYLGGSPTNVAMNMARLGLNVKMVATVGNDGFGDYILKRFREVDIDTSDVREIDGIPSTVIFVNRTTGTPEFIPMRGADCHIESGQITLSTLDRTRIYHTSCFALSRSPARETILEIAQKAHDAGCQLSIDINYSKKIWPNTQEALETIKKYCALGPLVKVSQDDMDRLFGRGMSHEEIFTNLHKLGAKLVCLTLGKEGAKLSEQGKPILELSALKVDKIMDATGAGDAFWSGFLFAWIKGKSNQICMETALKMAAIKLQNVGRIPDYALIISSILNN